MQQLSRSCQVVDHKQKVIEYVCVYPQCKLSRFLCSKCTMGKNHKHNQQDDSHFLDSSDFYEQINKNLDQAKGKQQQKKFDIENSIVPLKQLMQEIQNLLQNIQNIIQQLQSGILQNMTHLENQLANIQKFGFNQIDDQSLNNLINIPQQQQDLDIYKQLEDQANLIIQNALKIKEWSLSEVVINQKSLSQKINDQKQLQLIRFSKCPKNHSLQSRKQTKSTRKPNCDSCRRKQIHLLGEFWFCKACNYDICIKCRFHKKDN